MCRCPFTVRRIPLIELPARRPWTREQQPTAAAAACEDASPRHRRGCRPSTQRKTPGDAQAAAPRTAVRGQDEPAGSIEHRVAGPFCVARGLAPVLTGEITESEGDAHVGKLRAP